MSGFLQCKIEAETIGSELQNEDVTHHMICPACKGGESGEKSFVVFTDEVGGIGWKCHRASCDQKGFMDSKGYLRMGQQIPEPPISPKFRKRGHSKPLKPFTGKVEELTRQQKLFLRHTIGFTQYHIQRSFVGYHNDSGRYVFPILDSRNNRRGCVLRSFHRNPKSINRMEKHEPCMSWYMGHGKKVPVIIVEDIPSAVRAVQYMNSVALLGVTLTDDGLTELVNTTEHVIWALDNDAFQKGQEYNSAHNLLFKTSNVELLNTDIKDMKEEQLCDLMLKLQS